MTLNEHNRFMVWLSAFAGAMLAVVLSGNLLMMFIAWELTSVTSFVLIGFKGAKDREARDGAFRALFVTGAGALGADHRHRNARRGRGSNAAASSKAFSLSPTSTRSWKRRHYINTTGLSCSPC